MPELRTNKVKTYIFHTDAGHGWLAVKRKELIALNILSKISPFSYQAGGTVYLEEDCDATIFMSAKEQSQQKINVRDSYRDPSPIRAMEQFNS